MNRIGTNSECRARKGGLVAVFALFALVLNPATPAESDNPAARSALEVTSGQGRPLYALPDDQAVIEARASLQADPKSVVRVLKLSLAQEALPDEKDTLIWSWGELMRLRFIAPRGNDLVAPDE